MTGGEMSLAADACYEDRPGTGRNPGALLRRARERRRLTIEDLARITKINKATLTAIETADVLHLPAAIYTRGFVKSYAQEVGLDGDEAADRYMSAIEPLTAEHLLVDDGMLPPLAQADADVDANDDARHLLAANQVRRFGRLTTAAAAVGLVLYLFSFGDRQPAELPPAQMDQVAGSDVTPASSSTVDPAAGAPDAAFASNQPLRLELRPKGPCWVTVSVDGEPVFARLLQAGDHETFEFEQEAVMRIGDPGAFAFSINGRPGRTLGEPGEPVDVTITKDNVRSFITA